MGKCNFKNCERDSFENEDNCILHCKKNEYQVDRMKIGFLGSFYTELIDYSINSIFRNYQENIFPAKSDIKIFLEGTSNNRDYLNRISDFMKEKVVKFDNIIFPDRDSRDLYDYKNVIDRIDGVHFDFCEFYVSSLDLNNAQLFFQECLFHERWYLYNHKVLENVRNVLYQMCNFKEDVCTVVADYKKPELDNSIFSDCIFEKGLILENVILKSRLFNNTEYKMLSIKKVDLLGCTFKDKFILNNYNIDKFICIDSFYNEKIEFKKNQVTFFEINNTNFSKLVDCYKTVFQKFQTKKSIFEDFVNFEECEFGLVGNIEDKDYLAVFLYATMMSFINFRKSNFISGLDLAHINLKEPPNFLNAIVSTHNSNRETFRIIKNSFDKVGNYIEANNFYVMEMMKFKEELKHKKKRPSYLLLRLYEITSNYGQSYIRPIGFIILFSIIYWLLILGYENNLLYSFFPSINNSMEYVFKIINGITKHIIPISKVLKENMEFISLFFYIIFTSFIWLIILAIKRSTKR